MYRSQFELDNFAIVNIEHHDANPISSLFGKYANHIPYMENDLPCIYWMYAGYMSGTTSNWQTNSLAALLYMMYCNPKPHLSVKIAKSFELQTATRISLALVINTCKLHPLM